MAVAPMTEIDMFATSDRRTRYEQYRHLRDLGGVVRLRDPDVYAVTRYDEVKAALADHDAFVSGEGVGFDPGVNQLMRGVTLVSDPPEHEVLRSVVGAGLRPGPLRARGEEIGRKARDLVAEVVAKGEIDGVTELAQALPMLVIPDYLGLPERNREHLYAWGQVGNDLLGPASERTAHNMEMTRRLFTFAHELAANRELAAGSPGAAMLEAADQGVIAEEKCPLLLVDFIGPSLETTAAAIGHLLVLFAERPDQWDALRAEPALVASTINELLRFETPVRGLTRVAAVRDMELGGVTVPQGARDLGPLRLREPRRTQVGACGRVRLPPQSARSPRIRIRRAQLRRPGRRPSGTARRHPRAARLRRTRRAHRASGDRGEHDPQHLRRDPRPARREEVRPDAPLDHGVDTARSRRRPLRRGSADVGVTELPDGGRHGRPAGRAAHGAQVVRGPRLRLPWPGLPRPDRAGRAGVAVVVCGVARPGATNRGRAGRAAAEPACGRTGDWARGGRFPASPRPVDCRAVARR